MKKDIRKELDWVRENRMIRRCIQFGGEYEDLFGEDLEFEISVGNINWMDLKYKVHTGSADSCKSSVKGHLQIREEHLRN